MWTNRSRRRLRNLVIALYVLAIASLVYLQFGGRQVRRDTLGQLEVTALVGRGILGGDRVRELRLRYGPVRLSFSGTAVASLEDRSQTTERLRSIDYRTSPSGVLVSLGDRVQLSIEADEQSMVVRAVATAPLPAAVELSLPIDVEPRAAVLSVPGLPLLRIGDAGCTTYVAAADGSRLDPRRVRVQLRGEAATAVLSITRCSTVADAYRFWFSPVEVSGDPGDYRSVTADYLGRSYGAWQAALAQGGLDVVSRGRLTTAFLTESLARGSYPQAVAALQPQALAAFARGVQAERALPAVFLGMLPAYLGGQQARSLADANRIGQSILSSDPGVFSDQQLYPTVFCYATPATLRELLRLAAAIPVESADPERLLDLARFYVELERNMPGTEGAADRLGEIITDRLLSCIRRTPRGAFFLPSATAAEGLDRTFVVGRLLIEAAALLGRDSFDYIGRQCILSALSLASSDGTLPARIRVDASRLVPTTEALPSEEVYAFVAEDRYHPSVHSLLGQMGAGVWLLSAARIESLSVQGGTLRAAIAFPAGQVHYLVLQGAPAPTLVQLHGFAWRPDPEYNRYTDGWWYAPETQTLVVKLLQQREREELSVTFP